MYLFVRHDGSVFEQRTGPEGPPRTGADLALDRSYGPVVRVLGSAAILTAESRTVSSRNGKQSHELRLRRHRLANWRSTSRQSPCARAPPKRSRTRFALTADAALNALAALEAFIGFRGAPRKPAAPIYRTFTVEGRTGGWTLALSPDGRTLACQLVSHRGPRSKLLPPGCYSMLQSCLTANGIATPPIRPGADFWSRSPCRHLSKRSTWS